jgi:hypothetical protein
MSHPRAEASTPGPGRALGDWRRRRLIAAGVEPPLAARLAHDEAIDLHELLVLLDRGCPPRLAARILAPLDAEELAW